MEGRALAGLAALVCLVVLVAFAPVVGGAPTGSSAPPVATDADATTAANATVTASPTATPSRSGGNETITSGSNGTATTPLPNGTAAPNETATPNGTVTPTRTRDTNGTVTPGGNATPTPDSNETATPTPTTPNGTPTTPTPNETPTTPTPPGMDVDPIGWEGGLWYNDSLPIDRDDGLNRTELESVVARTMARVEAIRRLEYNGTVSIRLRSRASYRRSLDNRTVNESLRTFDNAKFEALFLVDEFRDSITVLGENAAESLLGYYDPRNDSIVLLFDESDRDSRGGPPVTRANGRPVSTDSSADGAGVRIDERVLAHELVHALQDQQFGLERYTGETRDEANAMDALIEGDASLVERRYTRRCREEWAGTCLTTDGGEDGSLANTGVYLVTYFPYSDGPAFVREFYRRGGWTAVNDLYDRPPASAEQVIHPETYPDDDPANVSFADETASDWTRVSPPGRPDHAELGEAALVASFVYPMYDSGGRVGIVSPDSFYNQTGGGDLSEFDPFDYDQPYSAGWDGDRLHVYRNDEDETGYVWRLAWDSSGEATEFYRGYRQLLAYWGASRVGEDTYRITERGFGDAFHVRVDGSTVTIVNAPDVWSLREVRTSLWGEIDRTGGTGTMTVPADARLEVPSQPGFGPAAAVIALVLLGYGRSRYN
jgi:PGF-CTERM protein